MDSTQFSQFLSIAQTHSILEYIYYFSNIVIAVVGVIALFQLKIAKEDIRIRSRRDAIHSARELCLMFNKEILPIHESLRILLKENNVKPYDSEPKYRNADLTRTDRDWIFKALSVPTFIDKYVVLNNALAIYAQSVLSGLCDEKFNYQIDARNYCDVVHQYSPILAGINRENLTNDTCVFELYKLWASKQTRQKLAGDIASMYDSLSALKISDIKPLGT